MIAKTPVKDVININGERDLVRDKESKAILSRNYNGLEAYKMQRSRNNKILEYENDINTLKKEITEIRQMLNILVNKTNRQET